MTRIDRRRLSGALSLFAVSLIVATTALSVGCKKNPPAATATPSAPAAESTPSTETIHEEPLTPVATEQETPARSVDASEYNRRGVLKTIYFDFDKFNIRDDQKPTLRENVRWLKGELSRFNVLIEGHCDERGTNEYNLALGDRRANAARVFLINLGVPASRIRTISYGEERPADPRHNEEAWARNRRAAFVLEEG
ncbi:MAG: peptidoglycan-associated lipoprotein Pal [Acidobacteriota bacterium]